MSTWLSIAGVLGTAFGLVIFVQVALSPILGYSDNGDFNRITDPLGLVLPDWGQRNGFVNPHLAFGPVKSDGFWNISLPVQHLLVDAARWLGAESFDIRWLGTLYAVAGGLCLWLLLRALPGRLLPITIGLVLLVVLGDSAFVAYFDSYYSEPGSLVGLLLVLAALFALRGRRDVPVLRLVLLAAAAAVLVLAKVQNVPLLIVLVPALLLLKPRKVSLILGAGLLVIGGAFLHGGEPAADRGYYVYDTVFTSILPHSPDPQADLRDLGLDPALVRYSHSSAYHYGDYLDPSFQRLVASGGHEKLFRFYLRHPQRAIGLAVRGTRDAAELRPSYLGNRVAADGYPRTTMACELCLYSSTSRALKPAAPVLLPALYVLALVTERRLRRRARREPDRPDDGPSPAAVELRTLADGIALTALLGVVSFATALAGEGDFELVKHLYLFEVTSGVLVALLAAAGVLELRERRRRRTSLSRDDPYPDPSLQHEPVSV